MCCALPEGCPVKPQSPTLRPIPQLTHTGSDRARPPPDVTHCSLAALESHLGPGPSAIHLGRVDSLAPVSGGSPPPSGRNAPVQELSASHSHEGRVKVSSHHEARVLPVPCSATQASRAPVLPRGPGARVQLREPATDWRGNSSPGATAAPEGRLPAQERNARPSTDPGSRGSDRPVWALASPATENSLSRKNVEKTFSPVCHISRL